MANQLFFKPLAVQLRHHRTKYIPIIDAANVANKNIDVVSVTEHDLLISSEIPKSDFYVHPERISPMQLMYSKAISRRAGGDQSVRRTMQNTKALAGEEDITCATPV